MGMLQDYFTVANDDEALVVASTGVTGNDAVDKVEDTGIDPVVQLTTLAALLTGREYDELKASPVHTLDDPETFEHGVIVVPDAVSAALAAASQEDVRAAVEPWSRTEEFWGAVDLEGLTAVTLAVAALAGRARASDQRLYCWWSL